MKSFSNRFVMYINMRNRGSCNDLKLELRLQLRQRLEKDKGRYELVKCKDTGMYLHYIYD